MPTSRTAATPRLAIWATLLALVLALRLLTPAGFMPAFDHGAVTIVACPDWDGEVPPPMAHHHHQGGKKALHLACPYAAASGLGGLTSDVAPLIDVAILAIALLLGRAFLLVECNGARERPPTRAPPFPA